MDITVAAEHLRQLAKNCKCRSKTGQLRELYDDIESARQAGVTIEKIVDELNAIGFDISHGTFVTLFQRVRRQKTAEAAKRQSLTQLVEAPAGTSAHNKSQKVKAASSETANNTCRKAPPSQQQLKALSRSNIDLSQYEDDE